MRVLQVIDSLGLGGAEVLVSNLAPAWARCGVECDIAVLTDAPSPLASSLRQAGIAVLGTGIEKLYSPRQVSALCPMFHGYDLVHVHLFPAQLWAVLAAGPFSPRTLLITTEHNTWNARRRWWIRPLDAWMYSHYRRIACNSDATAAELVRWCPLTKHQIDIIPNGIPLEQFETAQPAEFPLLPTGVPRLIFVGRFDPQKDHATILRALPSVPNVHALLIGDGPLRGNMEDLAQRLGVSERVSFLGRRSDVPQVLKASDVYVHSTTSDGFGIAACEAMAAGLPVIASNVPGLAQMVGDAGLFFPVGDHAALARQLNTLLAAEPLRQRMNAAGRARAKLFSIERCAEQYIELYKSVLRDRSGPIRK